MAEIKLTFDLTFTRRFMSRAGAIAIMLCAVPELDSESVTLSTYYPAPSGVYTNMITTGNTFLARDGGNVGVGTTGPSYKMHVNGTLGAGQTYLTNSDIYFNNTSHAHTGIGNTAGHAAIENASNYNTLMILGRAGGIGGGRSVSVWDRLDVNGTLNVTAALRSGQGPAGCSAPQQYSYGQPSGGTAGLCGGQYVTTVAGFYTKYIALPIDRSALISPPVNNSFTYMCCNCPSGGCDL